MKKKVHPRLSSGAIALVLLVIGLMALFLWAVAAPNTPESSTCCQPASTTSNTAQGIVEAHTFELTAWCDHQPIWKEGSDRRHLAVEGGKQTAIQAVEVRVGQGEHKRLLGAYVRLGAHTGDLSKIQVEGVFQEGMHGVDLEVIIRYTVNGIRFETIRHCAVEVTN